MKSQKHNSLTLWVSIFTLISVIAVGSISLSLERTERAFISNNMSKLNRQMELLTRQNLDLTSRIANLESPDRLKQHLGRLNPISDNKLIVQNYNIESSKETPRENVALGYTNPSIIGTINVVKQ